VRWSDQKGYHVVALRKIVKGEAVTCYDGTYEPTSYFCRRDLFIHTLQLTSHDHKIPDGERYTITGKFITPYDFDCFGGCFFNSSRVYNVDSNVDTEYVVVPNAISCDRGKRILIFRATRDIEVGAEILYDYTCQTSAYECIIQALYGGEVGKNGISRLKMKYFGRA